MIYSKFGTYALSQYTLTACQYRWVNFIYIFVNFCKKCIQQAIFVTVTKTDPQLEMCPKDTDAPAWKT